MSVIDLKKDQKGVLADAINEVSHDIWPEDYPEPLTGEQILIYGSYEDYWTDWWGWENAKAVTVGPHPIYLPWPKADTQKFKFVAAPFGSYFNGHIDLSWLTKDDFTNGKISQAAAIKAYGLLIDFCELKGINWTGLFPDVQLPIVQWDWQWGLEYSLAFHFTVNVVVGPIFLYIPNEILD